eukprot:9705962-Ditylum_brightwellii.AAC.2
MSLGINNMYPFICVCLIQKALYHYASKLPASARKEILQVQWSSRQGLYKWQEYWTIVIGGYKSAFPADIVTSYLFEMTAAHFIKDVIRGIYHDDSLVVFKGHCTLMQ